MRTRSIFLLVVLATMLGVHHCKDPDNNTKLPPVPSEEFPHSAELDELDTYFLYWKFDNERITFEVHVRTLGWVGFGLTDNGRMVGADMVVGWITNGTTFFKDRHAVANEQPIEDVVQDYDLLSAKEQDGFTIFKFSRLLKTCDDQDYQLKNGTVRVIFAWNDDEPTEGEDFQYHGPNRGARSILFLDYGTPTNDTMDDMLYFDVLQKNFEPLIQSDNLGVVHHFLLFHCYGNLTGADNFACLEGQMPVGDGLNCQSLIFAWAIGQQEFYLPEEAGLSIGDVGDPTYYMIETHYDNPQNLAGKYDSSGLRLHYTDNLRTYDVGLLTVGNTVTFPPLLVPPHMDTLRVDGFCGTNCTKEIPEEGIHIFAVTLHTHTHGIAVLTRHHRNGVELSPIGRDDNYDFNYQAVRALETPRLVLPGDELLTSCVYSTPTTDEIVWGGPTTENEMCLVFMLYYPRMSKLQGCQSNVQSLMSMHAFVEKQADEGVFGPNITSPIELWDTYEYLSVMPWDDSSRMYMQSIIDNVTNYYGYCIMNGMDPFGAETVPNAEMRMTIETPYVEEDFCALTPPTTPKGPIGGSRGLKNGHVTVMAAVFVSVLMLAIE